MSIDTRTIRARTARAILATAVIAAGGLTTATASAGPVEDNYRRCMTGAAGSADSQERRSQHCDVTGEGFATNYHDCMRGLFASPDSLERWVGYCAGEAAATAAAD